MKTSFFGIIISCLLSLSLYSCDDYEQTLESLALKETDKKVPQAIFDHPTFYNNYKNFFIEMRLGPETDYYVFGSDEKDSRIEFKETVLRLPPSLADIPQPKFIGIKNILKESVLRSNKYVYVIVDRSLPQKDLDDIKSFMKTSCQFFENKFFAEFVGGSAKPKFQNLSQEYLEFNSIHIDTKQSILKPVVDAIDELKGKDSLLCQLLVFSNGYAYKNDNNEMLDPEHIDVENSLLDILYEEDAKLPVVTYVNITDSPTETEQEAALLMQQLVQKSGGEYFPDNKTFPTNYISKFAIDNEQPDFILEFENPKGKKYLGLVRSLDMSYYYKDELVLQAHTNFRVGDIYGLVMVGDVSILDTVLQLVTIFLVVFLLTYLIGHIIIPYIRYKKWYMNAVYKYSGSNMTAGGFVISEKCCYCKDDFKEGEMIVANCNHNMHLKCWEANGCKCPEHGYHNHNSKYYYNRNNLFDSNNSPFYMRWILWGLFTGFMAYLFHLITNPLDNALILSIVSWLFDLDVNNEADKLFIDTYARSAFSMPDFSFCLTFFVELYLGLMIFYENIRPRKIKTILLIAFDSALIAFVIFLVYTLVCTHFRLSTYNFSLDWIPFALTILALFLMPRNNINYISKKKKGLALALSMLLGLTFMYMSVIASISNFPLDLHILACMLFVAGLGFAFARKYNSSLNYCLHVTGQIKEMDIAIYKLLRLNEKAFFTIGRSIDCDIQISWDTEHIIEPVVAKVSKNNNGLMVEALESGLVVKGNTIALNTKIQLEHGEMFSIGSTTFTYVEKDA